MVINSRYDQQFNRTIPHQIEGPEFTPYLNKSTTATKPSAAALLAALLAAAALAALILPLCFSIKNVQTRSTELHYSIVAEEGYEETDILTYQLFFDGEVIREGELPHGEGFLLLDDLESDSRYTIKIFKNGEPEKTLNFRTKPEEDEQTTPPDADSPADAQFPAPADTQPETPETEAPETKPATEPTKTSVPTEPTETSAPTEPTETEATEPEETQPPYTPPAESTPPPSALEFEAPDWGVSNAPNGENKYLTVFYALDIPAGAQVSDINYSIYVDDFLVAEHIPHVGDDMQRYMITCNIPGSDDSNWNPNNTDGLKPGIYQIEIDCDYKFSDRYYTSFLYFKVEIEPNHTPPSVIADSIDIDSDSGSNTLTVTGNIDLGTIVLNDNHSNVTIMVENSTTGIYDWPYLEADGSFKTSNVVTYDPSQENNIYIWIRYQPMPEMWRDGNPASKKYSPPSP